MYVSLHQLDCWENQGPELLDDLAFARQEPNQALFDTKVEISITVLSHLTKGLFSSFASTSLLTPFLPTFLKRKKHPFSLQNGQWLPTFSTRMLRGPFLIVFASNYRFSNPVFNNGPNTCLSLHSGMREERRCDPWLPLELYRSPGEHGCTHSLCMHLLSVWCAPGAAVLGPERSTGDTTDTALELRELTAISKMELTTDEVKVKIERDTMLCSGAQ